MNLCSLLHKQVLLPFKFNYSYDDGVIIDGREKERERGWNTFSMRRKCVCWALFFPFYCCFCCLHLKQMNHINAHLMANSARCKMLSVITVTASCKHLSLSLFLFFLAPSSPSLHLAHPHPSYMKGIKKCFASWWTSCFTSMHFTAVAKLIWQAE